MIKVVNDIDSVSNILDIINEHSRIQENRHLNMIDFKLVYEVFKSDFNHIYFVVKYDNNTPVSGLPLIIDKKGTLRFVNDKSTDVYERVGYGFNSVDFKRLTIKIRSDIRIKRVEFKSMSKSEDFIGHMRYFFGSGSMVSSETGLTFLKRVDNQFIGHLNSKRRSELRRILNSYQNMQVELISYPSAFPQRELEALAHTMVTERRRSRNFLSHNELEYVRQLYIQGKAELIIRNDVNSVEAINILLKYNDSHVMFWIDLYKNKKNINLANYIEFIVNYSHSYNRINFGRGIYNYKMKNFEPYTQNLMTLRYSKNPLEIWFYTKYMIREILKQLMRR